MREHALAVPCPLRESRAQHALELVARELAYVIVVVAAALTRVYVLVGRGDEERTRRGKHAPELVEHGFLCRQMLDRLEGNDEIEAGVGEGQRGAGASEVTK